MQTSSQEWMREFQEFLGCEPQTVPLQLSQRVQERIHRLLNPALARVFLRLAVIHGLISVVTLSLCPHFGVEIIGGFGGLSAIFMRVGERFCMLACGGVFMGVGIFCALFLLPVEYALALKRHRLFHLVLLTFLSCGVLVAMGTAWGFSGVMLWLAGGLIGSLSSLELGWRIRHLWKGSRPLLSS